MCCAASAALPSLQEPFGLTLIEAAAHGVPIVATTNGGPVDIVNTLSNGILVDPTKEDKVAEALLELLTNGSMWDKYSSSGVTNINAYSWSSHCMKCLSAVEVEKVGVGKKSGRADGSMGSFEQNRREQVNLPPTLVEGYVHMRGKGRKVGGRQQQATSPGTA